LAAGRTSMVYPLLFGRGEGLLSEECTGGFFPAGLKTQSGLLWFSTAKGVVVVDSRAQPVTTLGPNTVLEEVVVDGVSVQLRKSAPQSPLKRGAEDDAASMFETLRISPGKHRVEFRYTGLSYDAAGLIRFRYRLDGLGVDWVDAGKRRVAEYSYLPPGDYRFSVVACSNDGAWSDREAGLRIVILRHFWQSWWFIAGTGIGLMASVAGSVRLVVRKKLQRRLKRLEQERALERERTRIAQDLHDEMGAKLCRISFLSEHARGGQLQPGELQEQITSISDASREVLHSLDEIVWAVDPHNDNLEHVASYIGQYALDYFQMTGVQCELDIPTQLPPHPLSSQMRHHLFLATHEALTNILKHSGATHAKVAMNFNEERLEISISDDGKGFNPEAVEARADAPGTLAGDGLINMRQRLADLGGQCSIESIPGKGTLIRFVLPLPPASQDLS
jgi:signal transduction histidine kinase